MPPSAGAAPADLRISAVDDGVVTITIARPEARNALRHQTMIELADAITAADRDEAVRCIVLAGGEKAFAAGADIAEMIALDGPALEQHPRTEAWRRIWASGCPMVAAVEGLALGGGCELVLSCDIAIAGSGARFGQPEITLGWMPGAGGTQRLARSAGKSVAMQLVLTGDPIDAAAALRSGMVSEMVAAGDALARATAIARRIASQPRAATRLARHAVLLAFETPLADGVQAEQASFRALASSDERHRRMRAFLERPR
ncbi:MAG: enoyl-CoA hydratase-related protein [Gemmatimonadota bacterium]|nr:enoyl-CoA hydratase-related protein [Gemmatimonadota bacterium]MDQ8162726.1 enoyl-CoA hydratase-related protein [Gemmatimonadota bacterium]MDQ8167005.1 enoyl-CoA hydratase-related protein [Gemmatimonadota bacterium]MDQ8172834.1 enoyl-CoA hydratase-related protein [Gemmatimonadota bacterium]